MDETGERWVDPVVEAYKKDVDVSLLRENLALTPLERLRKHAAVLRFVEKHRGAARKPDDRDE